MIQDIILLSDRDFGKIIYSKYKDKGGIYKIIAVRDGKRILINRFLGVDESGVLYIGKATSFKDRVVGLKKSISPEYRGSSHICGRRYKANPNIAKQFPFEILHIELMQSDCPEELEREMLNEYTSVYGEVPPLNAV